MKREDADFITHGSFASRLPTDATTKQKDGDASSPTPVWLDCDPGHDDAMAIILAGYNDTINLLGISAVAGNQLVEKTTLNAAKVLTVAGIHNVSEGG